MASEFDTIDELKADVRSRLSRVKVLTQGVQARDKVLEALLDKIDVPMPEHTLEDEVAYRKQEFQQQLQQAGLTAEVYAQAEDKTVEELDNEIATNAASALKAQFVLDAIAKKEELQVAETDITDQIVRRAAQAGVRPDAYAQQIVNSGNLGNLMGDILRGKALALVLEKAAVTDESGRPVDLEALNAQGEDDDDDAADVEDVAQITGIDEDTVGEDAGE
jgi:trigger factor